MPAACPQCGVALGPFGGIYPPGTCPSCVRQRVAATGFELGPTEPPFACSACGARDWGLEWLVPEREGLQDGKSVELDSRARPLCRGCR
jgi:hypothetical protein